MSIEQIKIWLLGITPLLIYIKSFQNGIQATILCMVTFLTLALIISLLGKFISDSIRIPVILLISALVLTMIQMLTNTLWFNAASNLKVITMLLTVNYLLILTLEQAVKSDVKKSIILAAKSGIVFIPVFILVGILSEYSDLIIFRHAAGNFLLLTLLTASFQFINNAKVVNYGTSKE